MTNKIKITIAVLLVFIVGSFLFMFGNNLKFHKSSSSKEMPVATGTTNEIAKNMSVSQTFVCKTDSIKEVAVVFHRIYDLYSNEKYKGGAKLTIRIMNNEEVLGEENIKIDRIEDQHRTFVKFNEIKDTNNKELTLQIVGDDTYDSGMVVMMEENDKDTFTFGSMPVRGTICFTVN